jgi:integrase
MVSLAEAREKSRELRKVARSGGDPSAHRDAKELTFRQAAQLVHDGMKPTWRSERHAMLWWNSLENHVFPRLGNRAIQSIEPSDVLAVLSPIWTEKNDTARRLRQRIAAVFDWAEGAGHFDSDNPVNKLSRALPKVKRRAQHMAAMPWRDIPAFMAELKKREGVSARALEFLILTVSRSGEARGAMWSEIEGDCWTVPAERMKRDRPHKVPLSDAALGTLTKAQGMDADFCFPSSSRGKDGRSRPQSVMVFKSLYNRMGIDGITTHGFRSAFRDWASESAHAPREVAEAALAHAIGNEVEQAYARSDLFERRRTLMRRWAEFVTGSSGEVVRMAG